MKTKEREGAKKGGYKAVFSELIRPGNKVGLKSTKSGAERLMFRLQPIDEKDKPIKGAAVPYSFVWDLDDPRARAVMGAIGMQAVKVKKALKAANGSLEKTLIWFEKTAKEKAQPVYVFVREDAGFGSGIKPVEGEYYAQFTGIATRDKETNKPTYYDKKSRSIPRRDGKGNFETKGGNMFNAMFMVLTGAYKDALIRNEFWYAVVKDEEDEWMVDADETMGGIFKKLLTLHKINTDSIDPDRDFADPENGLPELEKRLLKRAPTTPMQIVVKKQGWMGEFRRPPEGTIISGVPSSGVEIGEPNGVEYAADNELIAKLFSMIDRRTRKHLAKSAWLEDGKLSVSGKQWLTENKLSMKFTTLSDSQIRSYIAKLKERFPIG